MILPARRSAPRRGVTATGALLILGALLSFAASEVGHESATAATLGTLAVLPATGDTDTTSTVALTSSAACPTAANAFVVTLTGAGLPTGINALGNNALPAPGEPVADYPIGQTWNTVVSSQGGTLPLDGTATLTLVCAGDEGNLGEFATTVTFTKAASGNNSTYVAGGAAASPSPGASPGASPDPQASPSPSPETSPSPEASPSPSPSAEPSPSPDPSAEPSPSPSPSPGADEECGTTDAAEASPSPKATPEASPEPDDCVDVDDSGGTVSGSKTDVAVTLPDSGGDSPAPLLLLAAIFGVLGLLILLYEAGTRDLNGYGEAP